MRPSDIDSSHYSFDSKRSDASGSSSVYCTNCGEVMDPLAAICIHCGLKKNKGHDYCSHCGMWMEKDICLGCGVKRTTKIGAIRNHDYATDFANAGGVIANAAHAGAPVVKAGARAGMKAIKITIAIVLLLIVLVMAWILGLGHIVTRNNDHLFDFNFGGFNILSEEFVEIPDDNNFIRI